MPLEDLKDWPMRVSNDEIQRKAGVGVRDENGSATFYG